MARCPRCKTHIPEGETECPFCLEHFPELVEQLSRKQKNQDTRQSQTPIVHEIEYVGFWKRLGAAIPDLIIAGIIAFFVYIILEQMKIPYLILVTLLITGVFFLSLYSPILISSRYQATVGKIAFGIIVVDSNGKRLTFPRALLRELGKYVSLLTCGIGFAMIGFTKKKQGLHDLFVFSVVVDRSSGLTHHHKISFDPGSVKKRLRVAAIIISICIICSVIPVFYFGTMSSKTITPQSIAAHSLTSTADTIADSKYPEYSLPVYDAAISLQPKDPEIIMKKVYVLETTGKVDEAQQYLESLTTMYPNETTPIIYTGDLFFQKEKYQEALVYYDKALSVDPNNAKIWIKKGDTYLAISVIEMQKMREVYWNLTHSTQKSSASPNTYTMDAFRSTQSYQEAVNCYNKAIKIDPFTSVAITGRIMATTQNLLNTYTGILDDIGIRNST
jgi:uncharacterized RDD family membrane protein YckC